MKRKPVTEMSPAQLRLERYNILQQQRQYYAKLKSCPQSNEDSRKLMEIMTKLYGVK